MFSLCFSDFANSMDSFLAVVHVLYRSLTISSSSTLLVALTAACMLYYFILSVGVLPNTFEYGIIRRNTHGGARSCTHAGNWIDAGVMPGWPWKGFQCTHTFTAHAL